MLIFLISLSSNSAPSVESMTWHVIFARRVSPHLLDLLGTQIYVFGTFLACCHIGWPCGLIMCLPFCLAWSASTAWHHVPNLVAPSICQNRPASVPQCTTMPLDLGHRLVLGCHVWWLIPTTWHARCQGAMDVVDEVRCCEISDYCRRR
jgi:hypothetical protein